MSLWGRATIHVLKTPQHVSHISRQLRYPLRYHENLANKLAFGDLLMIVYLPFAVPHLTSISIAPSRSRFLFCC